ncbi:MAG: hypothetical protein KZQ82_01480 [Candidatus Thiodiazotropha sp. (ex Lucinoma annulata)]|nr:hypothetical protein [Candidatus Thiodiazotropha sp. (ex Troendleina suluensis)]MCU7871491.1 hypothetical protein [Candidatus Thiodiazotropha sp. (ex Lucinoma borealis)]MCU7882846.1 hypothetical protein [Candidatus Thiodiazotropha sp. (ex Lucinoma annulata)]
MGIRNLLVSLQTITLALLVATPTLIYASNRHFHDASLLFDVFKSVSKGRHAFRHDTFGDESFWTDRLRLHEAIAGESLGGVGPGVDPSTALVVGLKVDVNALPKKVLRALQRGDVDLTDPATTIALLQLDAVVGVKGKVSESGRLESVGITCALCHSTVDDSFASGIGHRLDGWANRDLDPGVIISLAPDLSPFTELLNVDEQTVRAVLTSWGPGKFDASLLLDGKAFRPDGSSGAVLIPPAFGLAGVNLHTWTGWGSVTHWNAFVATLEMGGQGTLYDPRLNDFDKFPVAAANGFGDVRPERDLVTPKLGVLQQYQLALKAPKPPHSSYDSSAAKRGKLVFEDQADCARCHIPPLFTEPGWNLHTPEEIGIDDFQARRGPEDGYRTAPLKGLWTHSKGGYYHDGRFATLMDVVEHYDVNFGLSLSPNAKSDLVEYLKSL